MRKPPLKNPRGGPFISRHSATIGRAPMDGRIGGPFRYVIDEITVPSEAMHFNLGMDWYAVWKEPERMTLVFLRGLLAVKGMLPDLPAYRHREIALTAISFCFSKKGPLQRLFLSRREGVRPGYVISQIVRMVQADVIDKLPKPDPLCIEASKGLYVNFLGEKLTAFDTAERVSKLLDGCCHADLWKATSGIRFPTGTLSMARAYRKALYGFMAAPSWEKGYRARSVFDFDMRDSGFPVSRMAAQRLTILLRTLQDPQGTVLNYPGQFQVLQDWMAVNNDKMLRARLVGLGDVLINAGAAMRWVMDPKEPALPALAVRL